MANIIFKAGTAAGNDYPSLISAWNAIPADVIASGNTYEIQIDTGELIFGGSTTLGGKRTGSANGIKITAQPGKSFVDNPNILTVPYTYNPANGAALRLHNDSVNYILVIDNAYVSLVGIQLSSGGGGSQRALWVTENASFCSIDRCIIDSASQGTFAWAAYFDCGSLLVTNSTFVHRSFRTEVIYLNCANSKFENVDFIRTSDFAFGGSAISVVRNSNEFINCRALGVAQFSNTAAISGKNNGCSGTVSFGTGNKENLVGTDTVFNTVNDFRTKAGALTIDAGAAPSSGNTRAPNGVRQQGQQADMGAWEFPSTIQSPTATITSVSVNGRTVSVSGTTTGSPTSGQVSIVPFSIPYNNAVGQGPITANLVGNAFSAEFTAVRVGRYTASAVVTNGSFSSNSVDQVGAFDVLSARAVSVTQDPIAGQVLTIRGTTTGVPTSANLILPPDPINPNGATQQSTAVTLGSGTFNVSITLPAGNYDAGILTFTNADGTSLPQAGTSAVMVYGFSGNPEVPGDAPSGTTPTVTSVTVAPGTATGSTTFTATVTGTNSPPQTVNWSTTAGTINSSGVFTAPAPTASQQTITVTASSTIDQSKTGTATVTIAATAASNVTSVVVSPGSVSSSAAFTAVVNGANSPSQEVTWETTAGSINSSGVFTAPPRGNVTQIITITARSVQDNTKTGTATATIVALDPVISSVVVNPQDAVISGGGVVQFSAVVNGQNSPSQSVTWSSSAGFINSTGVFTAPAAASFEQSVTITAVSTVDNTKAGTSTVTVAATAPSPQRTVSLTMLNAASLSGLKWAWFDQTLPSNFVAPTDKGEFESTEQGGLLVIQLLNSQLPIGGVGWLIITNSDGSPATAHSAFCGPRAVS